MGGVGQITHFSSDENPDARVHTIQADAHRHTHM